MIITIKQIAEIFNEWNEKAFDNKLPMPHFYLMKTKTTLGLFSCRNIMGENVYRIGITIFFDRDIDSYINTIVHEMIHLHIKYNDIKDTSSHGKVFKQIANDFNKRFGLDIKRCNSVSGGVNEKIIERQKNKENLHEVVVLARSFDGHYYASVLPNVINILNYHNGLKTTPRIIQHKFVSALWSDTFDLRHCKGRRGLYLTQITKEKYDVLSKYKQIDV